MSPKLHLMLVQGVLMFGTVYLLVGIGVDYLVDGHLPEGHWTSRIVGAVIFGAFMGWYTWRWNRKQGT